MLFKKKKDKGPGRFFHDVVKTNIIMAFYNFAGQYSFKMAKNV